MFTYEIKGAKQVPIYGKDEKRAFTAVLSGSCKGKVLSVPSVWKGAIAISLPTKNASQEAFAAGHRFAFNRDTHWSSFTTTKAWIAEILLPYRDEMIKEHYLSVDAKMILYLEWWSVHRSQEFRDWIKAEHPVIIVLYVPAGCTGLFQPCDVGLQRLFKHAVKQSASQFFLDHVQRERINGTAPEDIRLQTKIGVLRDATPLWIMNAIQYLNIPPLNSPDDPNYIGANSWKNCKVGQWDLSYDSITSDIALSELVKKSAEFRAEIEGSEPLVTPPEIPLEEDSKEAVDGGDDEDVPMELSTLIVTRVDDGGLPTVY